MTQNIFKKILFIQLTLVSLLTQAQDPITNIDLDTDESGNTKNYIARDYIKLLPNFHYKPEAASQEYNSDFTEHITLLRDMFETHLGGQNSNHTISPDVSDYVYVNYPDDYQDFLTYLSKSDIYDPSIPVYVPVAPKSFTAKIDESMIFYADYNQAEIPFSTSLQVGTINGMAGVSPTGGGTYQIPIKLPPGTSGMMPNLGIVYNSQSPGGMLGKGWTISGFSAITRMPTNLHNDGFIDGVNFNANDKFALDGNRLVVTNDLAYGGEGTEYGTEMETFSQIYSYGIAGDGPEKFIVETKNGKTLEYGYTTDSRFVADGRSDVIIWLLNKVTDQNGNYYTIHYHIENKEYWPEEIKYTANDNASLQAYNSVKFFYDRRHDISSSFVANSEVNSSVLLRELAIFNEGNKIKKYEFKYDYNFLPHLSEVIAYSGNDNLNSTKIDWGEDTDQFQRHTFSNSEHYTDIIPGDFDGDGKTDMIKVIHREDENDDLVTQYGEAVVEKIELYTTSGYNELITTFTLEETINIGTATKFFPGDFNGDGKLDLLKITKGPGGAPVITTGYTLSLLLFDGEQFEPMSLSLLGYFISANSEPSFNIGDFNGDGKTDWVVFFKNPAGSSILVETYTPISPTWGAHTLIANSDKYSSSTANYKIADFNGNGKSEIMIISDLYNDYSNQIVEYEEGNTIMQMTQHSGFPTKDHRLFTGDFNGDGKEDLLSWVASAGWEIHLYGEGDFIWPKFAECPLISRGDPEAEIDNFNYIVSDYNGDGKADILEQWIEGTNARFTVYYSKSNFFTTETMTYQSMYPKSYDYKVNIDFNGDGKQECLISPFNYNINRIIYFHPEEQRHMVQTVTDGLNIETSFTYKPLTAKAIYTKEESSSSSVINIRPPLYVVSRLSDEKNHAYINYYYWGARVHNKGKGFLGFTKVSATNSLTLIKQENTFGYNPLFYNTYLESSKTYYGLDDLISETIIENKVENISMALEGKRFFPYVDWKEETDALNNVTITTDFTYDDVYFGNISTVSIDYDGEGTSLVTNNYIKANTWYPSALENTTITNTRNGKTPVTRTSNFTYDALGNSISKTDDAGTAKEITTTTVPNQFGLTKEINILSPNEETRQTTIEYDDYGRFAQTKTNPVGFVTKKGYDTKTGNVLENTDILENTTKYTYDAFGNLTKVLYSDGNTTNYSSGWTNGDGPVSSLFFKSASEEGSSPIKT